MMQLWAGLGNPGAQYTLNRHNVGYMAVDVIAETHVFSPESKKFSGLWRDGRIAGTRVILLKPLTFMNESGRSVAEAMRFFKLGLDALTVFHDELDLVAMKVRVKQGGGIAGHNGLRSINSHLGADFRRVRIGIGHPGERDRVTDYVLGNYAKQEMEPLSTMLGAIAQEAPYLIAGDNERFMNDVARHCA